jgi:glutamate N-acetyltransferase/amino-acid N-acetyltransferase
MTINEGPGIGRTPLPKGFSCGGVNSGVRRYRPDLGIIISDEEAVTVGVFTKNECKAAPILYCQGLLPSSHIRAIVTNSGQANAATGPLGRENNWKMALSASKIIGCLPHQVLTASTGVIGQHLAIDKITTALPDLIERVQETTESFALSILTTDLVPKSVSVEIPLSKGNVRITGICKGSGMIHPNMGTMLGYILSDIELPVPIAKDILKAATDVSFNMISVDGDTSTNDCVFLMCNGASEVCLTTDSDYQLFKNAITEVSQTLAKAIARDGEGATKLIEVHLSGAPDEEIARKAARGITVSPLIKSAIHGEDPNWGRILARLGAEGIPAHALDRMVLNIQGHKLFESGRPLPFEKNDVRSSLRSDTIKIDIDFNSGRAEATAWGCDLTKKYVEINTEYS